MSVSRPMFFVRRLRNSHVYPPHPDRTLTAAAKCLLLPSLRLDRSGSTVVVWVAETLCPYSSAAVQILATAESTSFLKRMEAL